MKSKIYRISEPDTPPKIFGNGKKGVMIVLQDPDKEQNIANLNGLVKAIKLDINEDVVIVSCIGQFTPIDNLLSSYGITTLILIGTSPEQIGFGITARKYFVYKMEAFKILLSDSLQELNMDKSKKMAFWQNLQSLFLS